jgi:hypothetical protein
VVSLLRGGRAHGQGAEAGHWYPPIVTLLIAGVLGVWAAYALSGAGVLQPLPLLAFVLPAITAVYLLRGLVAVALFVFDRRRLSAFWVWSSAICFVVGSRPSDRGRSGLGDALNARTVKNIALRCRQDMGRRLRRGRPGAIA